MLGVSKPLPFEFSVTKIEYYADWQTGDLEVIQRLPSFVIRDFLDHLSIHNDFTEHYQVWSESADLDVCRKYRRASAADRADCAD